MVHSQWTVADLGHEEPLTVDHSNASCRLDAHRTLRKRLVIANGIADGIDFFHRDALSSAVAMKITCDLQLTSWPAASTSAGRQVGRGYEEAKGRHIFRDFIDAVGLITLTDHEIIVQDPKRAHNPTDCSGLCQYRCGSALVGRETPPAELRLDRVMVLSLFPNVGIS